MACTANKTPFLRVIAKRGFAATACPRPLGQAADVQTTVLENKVVVASADSALPISRVSIVFRAGARHESYETRGASHMLRIAAGLTTQNSSGFAIARNIQQVGGKLTCTADREVVAYTVETTADKLETGLRYLQDIIQPAFKPWELQDSVARIRYHVKSVPPQIRAVELLHKAAFRNGLGNSLYIPKHQIGKLSSESLMHYHASMFTPNRCAVIGVGIDNNTIAGFAQSLELPSGSAGKSDSGAYHSGDARKDGSGNLAHVAIAGQGGALLNQKESLAFAILQNAVSGHSTKRAGPSGSFAKAASSAAGDSSYSFAAINATYSDVGLFGFVVSADAQHVGKIVDSTVKVLKSGAVTEADVARGKAQLKASILESYGSDNLLIGTMSTHALLAKQVPSADALVAAIDGISLQDVQEAAKKAGSSKLSVGAIGNLAHVPYASDLA